MVTILLTGRMWMPLSMFKREKCVSRDTISMGVIHVEYRFLFEN